MRLALLVALLVAAPVEASHGRPYSANVQDARRYAKAHVNPGQWPCLRRLVHRESGWAIHGQGPLTRYGRAYGLGQSLPGHKMAAAERPRWGPKWDDWRHDGLVQIAWLIRYARGRYGSMCHALTFNVRNGWF